MGLAFRLRTYPEILSAMFNTARSPTQLGRGVDLNRGSVIRTIMEAAATQDAEQYAQLALLLDLFDLNTSRGPDLDRGFQRFGSLFQEDLRRLGAQTSIGSIVVGDSNLQVANAIIAVDVAAGAMSFTIVQGAPTFVAAAGANIFMVTVGSAVLGQSETVLVSISGSAMSILSPTSGLRHLHRAGEPVRLSSVASQVAVQANAGATTVQVSPGTGVLFLGSSIILDRADIVKREIKTVVGIAGDVLTVSALAHTHLVASFVHRSTTGSDRSIGSGTEVYVPSNFGTKQIDFATIAASTLYDGDRESQPIAIESVKPGKDTKVASNTLTVFKSKPFATALVTNPEAAVRGRDREVDSEYLARGKKLLQSISGNGTTFGIEARVAGLLDPTSQRSVAFAQIIEPVGYGSATLYITDGSTTFGINKLAVGGREVLTRVADLGDRRSKLRGTPPYNVSNTPGFYSPRIFRSIDRGLATSTSANTVNDTTHAAFPGSHIGMWLKTADDQFYEITNAAGTALTLAASGATPNLGAYAIFNFDVDPLKPTVNNPPEAGADYNFNPSTGDLELITGLVKYDALVAADDTATTPSTLGKYEHSTGLGAYIQKVVNGDMADKQNFPGLKASGTQVIVRAPSVVSPNLIVRIEPENGFSHLQLEADVKSAGERVVNASGIGENVVLSDIIVEVKKIVGINDVSIIEPRENVPVLDGEIARITSANILVV